MCQAPFFIFSFLSSVGFKSLFGIFLFSEVFQPSGRRNIFLSALVQPGESLSLFFNNIIIKYSTEISNIAKNYCHNYLFIC